MIYRLFFSALIFSLIPSQARFGEAPFSLVLESDTLAQSSGDDVQVTSAKLRVSAPLSISKGNIISLTGSHEEFLYDSEVFDFSRLTETRLGVFTLTQLTENWRLMSISNIQASMAEGVNIGDSLTFNGIYGAWYSGWDKLIIGPGFGFSTGLDDGTSLFPIILFDWEFMEDFHLTTRPTPGTRFGPGLSLAYFPEQNWALYLGARYVNQQFQLKDSTFSFSATRLFTTLEYKLTDNLSLGGTVGMNVNGEIEISNEDHDLDSSFFGGVAASWQF